MYTNRMDLTLLKMNNDTREKVLIVLRRVTGRKIDDINLDVDLKSQLSLDSIQIVELFAHLKRSIELPSAVTKAAAFGVLRGTENNQRHFNFNF
jgi:acyl carrier protein